MALPYLDKLVSETLRLFPPMVRFNRRASADVKVCGRLIPRGVEVCVPVFAVHRDPRVWSDPDKFDPERFSREQSASRPDFSYIPFGAGPRCCIASQFALFQIKLAMVYLSKHFYFQTAPETEMPPKLENGGFSRAKNGIWLRIRPSWWRSHDVSWLCALFSGWYHPVCLVDYDVNSRHVIVNTWLMTDTQRWIKERVGFRLQGSGFSWELYAFLWFTVKLLTVLFMTNYGLNLGSRALEVELYLL